MMLCQRAVDNGFKKKHVRSAQSVLSTPDVHTARHFGRRFFLKGGCNPGSSSYRQGVGALVSGPLRADSPTAPLRC